MDLVSRDYAVADLIALERQSIDIEPVRTLFQQNRVIASITAELGQESIREVLSDPGTHKMPYQASAECSITASCYRKAPLALSRKAAAQTIP